MGATVFSVCVTSRGMKKTSMGVTVTCLSLYVIFRDVEKTYMAVADLSLYAFTRDLKRASMDVAVIVLSLCLTSRDVKKISRCVKVLSLCVNAFPSFNNYNEE